MAGLAYLHGIETVEVFSGPRPIQTARASVLAVIGTAPDADNDKFPLNQPISMIGGGSIVEDLGDAGTLPDVYSAIFKQGVGVTSIMVRVEEGADLAATISNILGSAADQTGVHAFKAAQAELGLSPRIFIAPGFTSQRLDGNANPVVSEMLGIATSRRGVIIADGPNTSKEDALQYRNDWGSDRVYIVDPGVKILKDGETVVQPASGFVAGVILRVDRDEGFHVSPSNHEIFGIIGIARPIEFGWGNRDTEANYLNENRVATIIRDGGFRLWGNETTSQEPLNKFLSVRRTHDIIMDSVADAHKWAADKPFSVQVLLDIAESVNGYLRILKARGVTLGGKVWIDPDKNTVESWLNGDLTVSYDAEAPAPMQHITFEFNRNTGYYAELADEAISEVERLST